MATKPKTQLYMVQYSDGYQIFLELNAKEYSAVTEALLDGQRGIPLEDIGVFLLHDVRSIIKQKPVEPQPMPEAADPVLTREEIDYVRSWKQAGYPILPTDEGVYS